MRRSPNTAAAGVPILIVTFQYCFGGRDKKEEKGTTVRRR